MDVDKSLLWQQQQQQQKKVKDKQAEKKNIKETHTKVGIFIPEKDLDLREKKTKMIFVKSF